MKNQNSLYLTYDGLTDPLGQSQVLPYLVGLSKKGWKITVISFEKPERFKALHETIHEQCRIHHIYWIPKIYHKSPPVFSTIGDLNTLSKAVRKVIKHEKPKLIHCRSYLPMLVALPFQKQGIKVIFDIRGFWADERVEGGIWNLQNPLFKKVYQFFKKKEKLFFKKADAIVSLTHAAVPIIRETNSNAAITVIPTATDLELFGPDKIDPHEKEKLKSQLGIKEQLVLGYSGSLGTWYLLNEMMAFFARLIQKKSTAVFLFVTRDDEHLVYELAQKHKVPESQLIIRKADRIEMPLYLSIMDLSVMLIKPSFSKIASSPTKLGELMAMGVPVVCNSNVGDVKEIVSKYKAGMVLDDLSETVFDKAIEKIIKDNNWYDTVSMRKGAVEYYDLEKGVEQYDCIYKGL